MVYIEAVIKNFRDKETDKVFDRIVSTKLPGNIQQTAYRKLLIIDAATALSDLLVPPGNRLEKLKGKRAGQYSIRINDQWRICFYWNKGNATSVEICDYHEE